MKILASILLSVCLSFGCVEAWAGGDISDSPPDISPKPPKVTAVFNKKPNILDAPPHGLWKLFLGKKIEVPDSVAKGSELEVIGRDTSSGFKGTHLWLKLKPIEKTDSEWWVYWGLLPENNPPVPLFETLTRHEANADFMIKFSSTWEPS